jgi:PIN domain nuclease of toxin-antitoxin system
VNKVVLDASAILAIIKGEPGTEKLSPQLLTNAVASTVNLAEVQTKLVNKGWSSAQAWEDATSPVREIISFDSKQARIAGNLASETKHLGLSLGDRACLALGLALNAPVYTTERIWKQLKLDVNVHVIR